MPAFALGADVHENVYGLRVALGSIQRELSAAGLAAVINARHTTRTIGATTVQRWEKEGVEPDIESGRIMAELAGVSFEAFMVGAGKPKAAPKADHPPAKKGHGGRPAPDPRKGHRKHGNG